MSDEVDFLHADKYEHFLQIDAMVFDGDCQAFSKFPKQQVCNIFIISQKEVRDEVDFLHAGKHQSFIHVDFNTLDIKVSYKVKLSLLTGMIKVVKVISLQYLKKEVIDGIHFLHADKQTRHVQSTQNRKLVMFCNIFRKKCRNCFCVLL